MVSKQEQVTEKVRRDYIVHQYTLTSCTTTRHWAIRGGSHSRWNRKTFGAALGGGVEYLGFKFLFIIEISLDLVPIKKSGL